MHISTVAVFSQPFNHDTAFVRTWNVGSIFEERMSCQLLRIKAYHTNFIDPLEIKCKINLHTVLGGFLLSD